MHKAKYSFKRTDGIEGFFKAGGANTDALNALLLWIGGGNGNYVVLQDEEDGLITQLEFDESDEKAGPELDHECHQTGIERMFLQKG